LGSIVAMSGTLYGRLLLAFKILLFLGMVIVALINRFRLALRISGGFGALGGLGCTVLEQSLGPAVLAIISILGTWPPST
jgi:putative copper export protein